MTTTAPPTTETDAPRPVPTAPEVEIRSSRAVWWRAYRHHLRLLRGQAIAWILVIAGVGSLIALGFQDVYPTQADRQSVAEGLEGVPAFEALFGRTVELATLEGFILWRWGGFAVLLVAFWGMLAAGRLLRGAEETGHTEPLRAGAISQRGLLAAVLAALFTVFGLLAVAVGATHTAVGMDAATSWVYGAGLALLAATFAGVSALAAQIVDSRRRVTSIVGVAIGVTLGIRILAAGTGTADWLWGATPFGWTSYLHEVDQARGQVLGAFVALVAVLVTGAFALARHDLHGAMVTSSEETVKRTRPVRGHAGLAVRLAAGPALVWGAILAASALVFGLLAEDFAAAMEDLPGTVEAAERIGWMLETPEGVAASLLIFLTLVLALFAAAQTAAIREEEASWRIEPILVRPVGRTAWLATRAAVIAAVVVVLAFLTALATWIGAAVAGGAPAFADLPLAAFNLMPITWMFLGIGVAFVGLVPRRTAAFAFGLVIATFVLDLVGGVIDLPERVLEVSPFRHITAVPAADFAVTPAVVMLAIGAIAAAVGLAAFRRRDLQEA
jgi:ABC-2 type transport system permease protein